MTIIAGILSVFLLSALILPLVTSAFGETADEWDTEGYETDIKEEARDVSTISAFSVIVNVMKLAFWDVGDELGLPFWLDLIFTLLAVVLILTVARNLWIGGGG